MLKELKKIESTENLNTLLFKKRKTPVSLYKHNNNLLHLAVYTGNLNVVKVAYEVLRDCNFHKKSLEKVNTKNETPINLAYRLSFIDIFLWLQNAETYRREKEPVVDLWADFFKNLEKSKINVVSNWVTYKGSEVRLKKHVAHYRSSVTKTSFLFAKEIGVNYDVKVPKFLKTPIKWYHKAFNLLSFALSSQIKRYPWKFWDVHRKNHNLTCSYLVIDSEIGKKFKEKARKNQLNPVGLFCAMADTVFQEELLTKKVSTSNFLTLNYTQVPEPRPEYHTELSFLPFKVTHRKKINTKAKKISNRLKWGVFWKKFLRTDLEITFFNYCFNNKPHLVKNYLNGSLSRFVAYSYFGDHRVDDETNKHDFIGLGRSNPFNKVSMAFHFKNDQLVMSLDVHPQVLENRSDMDKILLRIKTEIEEYVKI